MSFKPEDKVIWNQLSTSLQKRIKRKISIDDLDVSLKDYITKKITFNRIDPSLLSKITDSITMDRLTKELQDLIKNSSSSTILDIITHGSHGQLLKIDKENNSVFSDDNFHLIRVVDNSSDLDIMKKLGPIDLQDVFNNWERFSSEMLWEEGQERGENLNNAAQTQARNSWSYNASNKSICDNGNWDPTSGFISKITYDNYWIKLKMVANDNDDDIIGFVVAAFRDSSNILHTLSIIRDGGIDHQPGISEGTQFSLIYDFDTSRQKIIVNNSQFVSRTKWVGYIHLFVQRQGDQITAKCTALNSDTWIDAATISYKLPQYNPGLPETTWENLKTLLTGLSQVGFLTKSNYCEFWIEDQHELFEDDHIYDLSTGDIWAFINGSWVKINSSNVKLIGRSWLYNEKIGKLYWYKYPGVYYEI